MVLNKNLRSADIEYFDSEVLFRGIGKGQVQYSGRWVWVYFHH